MRCELSRSRDVTSKNDENRPQNRPEIVENRGASGEPQILRNRRNPRHGRSGSSGIAGIPGMDALEAPESPAGADPAWADPGKHVRADPQALQASSCNYPIDNRLIID